MKKILDACCGSRMFWYDKNRDDTVYMDNRSFDDVLCDGRKLSIHPDIVADFRNIPFDDNSFNLVVFDPPHLKTAGKTSWIGKKYGTLSKDWKSDISQGFKECMRVLKKDGFLVFKWSEKEIKLSEVLKIIPFKPLFGTKSRADTHWLIFVKEGEA